MADDPRNYIQQSIERGRLITGEEPSADEMALHFAKSKLPDRVEVLDKLSRDLASGGELSIEEALELSEYAGKLYGTHEKLRKVGR
jgi:hypothetical protein